MKKPLLIVVTGVILLSCSKKDISTPGAANQDLFYKDANIAVENLQACQTANGIITVRFSTVYEKNVYRIELMSSATTSSFCTAQGINTDGNSTSVKDYAFEDANLKGGTMYYLLRFKNDLDEWTYSDYCSVHVN
jgi:hypothetical protein